jgi:hypothetical protein
MAVCSNCGTDTPRLRSKWSDKGVRLPDECSSCSPGSFDKFTAPSDKKIWMGYEAHPNEYVKAPDGGYDRKPEYRAEQEAQLAQSTKDEQEAQQRAEDHKRATRRTQEMDSVEYQAAMRRANELAAWLIESTRQGTDVN